MEGVLFVEKMNNVIVKLLESVTALWSTMSVLVSNQLSMVTPFSSTWPGTMHLMVLQMLIKIIKCCERSASITLEGMGSLFQWSSV